LLFRNKVWEVPTGKLLFSLSANQLVKTTSIIFDTTNGNFYTTAERSQKFKKWDSKSGKLLKISSQKMPVTITKEGISDEDSFDFGNWKDIKFSGGNSVHKSGKVLILQGLEPILCDLNNERVLQTFYNHGHHDVVTSAMFNQDQSKILTASDDATSRLWAVKTGLTLRKYGDLPNNPEDPEYGHHTKVTSANFSPTFTEMVTSGWDGSAIIWNIKKLFLILYYDNTE
jgi:WD40 repeat protein